MVRDDLNPGYKVVQSAHAMADFAATFTDEFLKWQCKSNYLCCLQASSFKIERLMNKLDDLKIKYHKFVEPDIGNEMTAIAVEAMDRKQHKKLFNNFKLTLS